MYKSVLTSPLFWFTFGAGLSGKRGVQSAECGVRSVECGVRSVENAECGKRGVWKMWSVENAECGK